MGGGGEPPAAPAELLSAIMLWNSGKRWKTCLRIIPWRAAEVRNFLHQFPSLNHWWSALGEVCICFLAFLTKGRQLLSIGTNQRTLRVRLHGTHRTLRVSGWLSYFCFPCLKFAQTSCLLNVRCSILDESRHTDGTVQKSAYKPSAETAEMNLIICGQMNGRERFIL